MKKKKSNPRDRITIVRELNEFNWKVLNHKKFNSVCPYEMAVKSLQKLGIIRTIISQFNVDFIEDNLEFIRVYNFTYTLNYSVQIPHEYKPKIKKPKQTIIKIKQIDINKSVKIKNIKKTNLQKINVNSSDFLLSFEWRRIRMEALLLHGAKCQCCGSTPKDDIKINVDHIKPRKTHPHLALDINNLQVLCNVCNHGKGNWDSTDWR